MDIVSHLEIKELPWQGAALMISQAIRTELIHACGRMDQKGWVANHDGNLSVRLPGGGLALTPTARAKFDLSEDDILETNSAGEVISGKGKPFSELAIHKKIFEFRSDAQAVCHAHPPSATAVGVANQEMQTSSIPEAVVSLGPGVPLVGLTVPGSEIFWKEFEALIPHYHAVMVAGNGVFSWGVNLEQAFLRLELVEHLANILLLSLPLGGPQTLPQDQVAILLKKREAAGLALPSDPRRPNWFQ